MEDFIKVGDDHFNRKYIKYVTFKDDKCTIMIRNTKGGTSSIGGISGGESFPLRDEPFIAQGTTCQNLKRFMEKISVQ